MKKLNLNIAMAQIRTCTGDLQGNTDRIVEAINKAISNKADIVVFPELAISGYNCGMLFNEQHFIDYQLDFLNKVIIPIVPKDLVVVLGFVDCLGKRFDGNPEIQNSAAVIQDGHMVGKYAKILLANGGHHDDRHYFAPGGIPSPIPVTIKGEVINLGINICEDVWNMDHRRDIPSETVQNGADILIVLNQSYFYYGKQTKRRAMYAKHARGNTIYVVSVNNVGVGDITKNMMLYDGGSLIVGPYDDGMVIVEAKRFEEDFVITSLNLDKLNFPSDSYVAPFYGKYEEIFDAIIFTQREIFKNLGFEKALVAVSGGLDSSVTLPLVVEAMGKDNVIALSMPSQFNGDVTKTNAQQLCDALGVELYWWPIQGSQNVYNQGFYNAFNVPPAKINISTFDAVGRTVAAIAASQHFKAGLVSTSNHTEIVLNWFSWHDVSTAAVYGPLADLTKVEIFALAKYINERYNRIIVPENLYNGETMPGPELADATNASWDYYVVSGICAMLIRERKDVQQIVENYKSGKLSFDFFPPNTNGKRIFDLVPTVEEFEKIAMMCFERQKASVYKAAQSCPPLMMSPYSRGFSNREPIFNHYKGEYKFEKVLQPA